MDPSIKRNIGPYLGPFISASAFRYDCLRLSFTVRRSGHIGHHGDQSAADVDTAADDCESLDNETDQMMKRKCEIFEGWRSKRSRKAASSEGVLKSVE